MWLTSDRLLIVDLVFNKFSALPTAYNTLKCNHFVAKLKFIFYSPISKKTLRPYSKQHCYQTRFAVTLLMAQYISSTSFSQARKITEKCFFQGRNNIEFSRKLNLKHWENRSCCPRYYAQIWQSCISSYFIFFYQGSA